uniref:Uncharacterized protein n=1 Tax=Medicago truncatula TaxID=3880 RepID=I3T5K5_MEDTR|nr:unknown [Medicago truncatula]
MQPFLLDLCLSGMCSKGMSRCRHKVSKELQKQYRSPWRVMLHFPYLFRFQQNQKILLELVYNQKHFVPIIQQQEEQMTAI